MIGDLPARNRVPAGEETENGLKSRLRDVRWRLRRITTGVHYGRSVLEQAPILFGNSVPKSGTHLLVQVLLAFPRIGPAVDPGKGPILTFVSSTGRQRSPAELLKELNALSPGDLGFGHVISSPEIMERWCQPGVAHFFILRDPRDVVVSHAFFIADKAQDNVHHAYYQSLSSLDERLQVSILGRPDWEGDFPTIRQRFEAYLGWLECPWVCCLRFEDFITQRSESLAKMLDYAGERGFKLSVSRQQAIQTLADAIDPGRSNTFRAGRIGDWQKHFTGEHKRLFKEVSGDLLVRLGYEKDANW